jgi:phage baseplate assembly protein W
MSLTTPQYIDLDLSFLPHPRTHDVGKLTDTTGITRAIEGLLRTHPGERPFQPTAGSSLQRFLFEPMDAISERLMVAEIQRVMQVHEPRALLRELRVLSDEGSQAVTITFVVSIKPNTLPVSFTLTLDPDSFQRLR